MTVSYTVSETTTQINPGSQKGRHCKRNAGKCAKYVAPGVVAIIGAKATYLSCLEKSSAASSSSQLSSHRCSLPPFAADPAFCSASSWGQSGREDSQRMSTVCHGVRKSWVECKLTLNGEILKLIVFLEHLGFLLLLGLLGGVGLGLGLGGIGHGLCGCVSRRERASRGWDLSGICGGSRRLMELEGERTASW